MDCYLLSELNKSNLFWSQSCVTHISWLLSTWGHFQNQHKPLLKSKFYVSRSSGEPALQWWNSDTYFGIHWFNYGYNSQTTPTTPLGSRHRLSLSSHGKLLACLHQLLMTETRLRQESYFFLHHRYVSDIWKKKEKNLEPDANYDYQ